MDLRNKKILITGGTGFLGKTLRDYLVLNHGCEPSDVCAWGTNDLDLVEPTPTTRLITTFRKFNVVFHLAATVGGIGANKKSPADFFYKNMQMGLNVIHHCMMAHVDKLVVVGSTCSYPKLLETPFKEEDLFNGYPEETNAPYGIAKRALLVMLQAYREQYGLNGIYVIPTNLYGPGDNFDLETSHVIPAIIKKITRSCGRRQPAKIWGSGKATRDFLHVNDCARGLVQAAERYDKPEPLNLGSGTETSIEELVHIIENAVVGFSDLCPEIVWTNNGVDGQPKRLLDITKARREIGFRPLINLREGIEEVVNFSD